MGHSIRNNKNKIPSVVAPRPFNVLTGVWRSLTGSKSRVVISVPSSAVRKRLVDWFHRRNLGSGQSTVHVRHRYCGAPDGTRPSCVYTVHGTLGWRRSEASRRTALQEEGSQRVKEGIISKANKVRSHSKSELNVVPYNRL